MEQEILALRGKPTFDGVEIIRRRKPATPPATASVPAAPVTPATTPIAANVPTRQSEPISAAKPAEPPIHPFVKAAEATYRPPHERNFAAVAKPAREAAYRHTTPIHDPKIAEDVYNRSMTTPCVTLTPQELFSLSPEVRQKVREVVTAKRITNETKQTNIATIVSNEEPLAFATEESLEAEQSNVALVIPDIYEQYLNTLRPGERPEVLTVAKDSHALRSIYLLVNNQENIECIVDPGSQIIAMSEAVCHDLGLAYDPTIRLNMQSANGEIDESLGLARNVPCRVSDITLYLQIHVIRSPAYDILIGRPFDVLTASVVKNYANEDQTITICDPNSGRRATVPTMPRGPPRHQSPPQRHNNHNGKTKTDFCNSRS